MSKPRKMYRLMPSKRDPRISLRVPKEISKEIAAYAKYNARNRNDEIIARLAATLNLNDEFMATDRLMRLIHCKKLAYKSRVHGLQQQHPVIIKNHHHTHLAVVY